MSKCHVNPPLNYSKKHEFTPTDWIKICVVYVTWYSELSWYFPWRPILIFSYSHFLFKPHQRHYNAPVTLLTGGLLGKYNFQICLVKFTLGTIYFKIASTEEPQSVVMFVCALGLCWIKGYFIWDWWNNQYLWHLGLLLNQKGRVNNLHPGS